MPSAFAFAVYLCVVVLYASVAVIVVPTWFAPVVPFVTRNWLLLQVPVSFTLFCPAVTPWLYTPLALITRLTSVSPSASMSSVVEWPESDSSSLLISALVLSAVTAPEELVPTTLPPWSVAVTVYFVQLSVQAPDSVIDPPEPRLKE